MKVVYQLSRLLINIELPPTRILWAILDAHFMHAVEIQLGGMEKPAARVRSFFA